MPVTVRIRQLQGKKRQKRCTFFFLLALLGELKKTNSKARSIVFVKNTQFVP
jgi:hypothetical protein